MRPVLRVTDGFARAVGAGGPRGPPEERRHLVLLNGITQRTGRNGIGVATVAVNVSVVDGELVEGGRAIIVESDGVGRGVVGIMAGELCESCLQGRALLYGEGVEVCRSLLLRPTIEDDHRLAVEIIGAPVGRDVGAVSPDGSNFLSAGGLPDVLSVANGFAGEQHAAVGGDDFAGSGRSVADRLVADRAQDGK